MMVETKSLASSGIRTKHGAQINQTKSVINSIIDHSSFNAWRDSINFKAVAFESNATKDALIFEIQQKRAEWDPIARQFRCPPETPAAGQFTNRLGEGCTTGFVRRLAARLGERLTNIGQGLGARRLDRGRDTELGLGAGARRTGGALQDWAQEGVDTPLMQARRARALARRGTLPDGTPMPRVARRTRARELRDRMLDRVSRLRELGRRVDWGWNEQQDEDLRRQQGLPSGGGSPLAPPVPGGATPARPTPGAPTPGVPTPGAPTPGAPTPGVPTPGVPTPGVPTPGAPTPGVPTPGVPTPGVPTPGVPTPSPQPNRPTPNVPPVPGRQPNRPTPNVPAPRRPPTPGRAPRPSTSPTGGRAGYIAGLTRGQRLAWLITNGIDPGSGMAVYSPRNQDWVDLSSDLFPGVIPDGKNLRTMTGDELDSAYNAFMAIAADRSRTDDERVIAARMAGKIAGQSRSASRKWEEFNNEWDAAMARATTDAEREAIRIAREQAARDLVNRIGVYGSITRERRDRSQAKMPRQDADANDWYDYINDLPDGGSAGPQTPTPSKPADSGAPPAPTPTPEGAAPPVPQTPTPRAPRQTPEGGRPPRAERERRGAEAARPTTPTATGESPGPTGGRGVRTRSRGRQAPIIGARRHTPTEPIPDLLDWFDEVDDWKAERDRAEESGTPFNIPEPSSPQGAVANRRIREALGWDSSKTIGMHTPEELDDLFEKAWNVMTDPSEDMLRRRLARRIARTIENENERRARTAGRTQGTRSPYTFGRFRFGDNYRLYVVPRRRSAFEEFLNTDPETYRNRHGLLNTPIPAGWRPEEDDGYGTAQWLSPFVRDESYVSAEDPPPFSGGDDISLGTTEPTTEVGAITRDMIDELDATLDETASSDADRQKAKEELVEHIEKIARQQEEETGDISDDVRDAYGIARRSAEEEAWIRRNIVDQQRDFFENPPILFNGRPNPDVDGGRIGDSWVERVVNDRISYKGALANVFDNRRRILGSDKEALADTAEMASASIAAKKTRAQILRLEARSYRDIRESSGLLRRAMDLEFSALAHQYALDDFIEEVSRDLAPETVEQMAEEVKARSAWDSTTDTLTEPFNGAPDFHSDAVAELDGNFAGLFEGIIALFAAAGQSTPDDFWRTFEQSLERIEPRIAHSTRAPEKESLRRVKDSLLRVAATRDMEQLGLALRDAIQSLFPTIDDVRNLRPGRMEGTTPASAFHYYRFNPMSGGSNFFGSRASVINGEAAALESFLRQSRSLRAHPPEMDEINSSLQQLVSGLLLDTTTARDLDSEVVAVIRDNISDLRRYATRRRQGSSDTLFSVAGWIDPDYYQLLTDPSVNIDDLGVNPRRAEEVRANATEFLNGLIDSIGGIETDIDGRVGLPDILNSLTKELDLDQAIGFLRDFDDQWFSQDLLSRLVRRDQGLDTSIARIIGGYVQPINTGRVNIDDPDQLDVTPPTNEMRERVRNMVRSVFAQRSERQRGRYEAMYPDGAPWDGDPLNNASHPLHETYRLARSGDLAARERIVRAAYMMPEFEVEIIERDVNGRIVRNADGTPQKMTYLFRVDPDSISIGPDSASGYIQARSSRDSDWTSVGHFARYLDWPSNTVTHSHMWIGNSASSYVDQRGRSLGEKLKGSGFSETFNGHALRTLRNAGMVRAQVSAASDGTYVWGRSGFRRGGNRSYMAANMRSEIQKWDNGLDSIVTSQDQANLWEYVASRLDETYDPNDPYDHIEAILAIDDSATFSDPDERRARSRDIKAWFQGNASFGSGTLSIEEVYGQVQPTTQSGPSTATSLEDMLVREAQRTFASRQLSSALRPALTLHDRLLLDREGSSLTPYYGSTRVNNGPSSAPTYLLDFDVAEDIDPVIADTSSVVDNTDEYVRALVREVQKATQIERGTPPLLPEQVQSIVQDMIRNRRDRIDTFQNLSSEELQNIGASLRILLNPETSEAGFFIAGDRLDSLLNPDPNPEIGSGLLGAATLARSLGVQSDEVLRGMRGLRVRDARDPQAIAREIEFDLSAGDIHVVLRPRSASIPDRPTYYTADSRFGHSSTGILYPGQELNQMGFDWDGWLRRDTDLVPSLYGFTRGQVQPEDIAALRMTKATYDGLVDSGQLADIPDSIEIQIIDGPDGLLSAGDKNNGPNIQDAINQVEETLTNESSETATNITANIPSPDDSAAEREQAWAEYFAANPGGVSKPEQPNGANANTNVSETSDISGPAIGVEEADEALTAAANAPGATEPSAPQTPRRPQYPRQPPAAAFEGRAEELFSGTRTWQGAKKILDDNDVIFLDYETTGIEKDQYGRITSNGLPTQIGAVRMRGGKVIDRFNVYINPGRPLNEWEQWSRENLRDADGNPITQEFLDGQISIADAHRQLAEWSGEGAIFGMQNAIFDNEVLERSLTESGIDWRPGGILDTKEIADMTLPRWTPENPVGPTRTLPDGTVQASNSLADITRYLGVELGDRHHTADYDAAATGEVLQRIVEGGIEGRWGADVLDPDKRDAKELQNQQDFNEAIERFLAANEQWRRDNAPDEQPLRIETTPPVARQRRGEAGGSDVKPRVRRGAVANEGQREATQTEKPATEPERAGAAEAPTPATPAPKRRERSATTRPQAEERAEPASVLDRPIDPNVGAYRVSFNANSEEWELDPNGTEENTSRFLAEQAAKLQSEYGQTLNDIASLNEDMQRMLESMQDTTRDIESDSVGDYSISLVEVDRIRSEIAQKENMLQQIEAAIGRIEDGTYGLSQGIEGSGVIRGSERPSNRPIPPARLQAIPTANYRVDELAPFEGTPSRPVSRDEENDAPTPTSTPRSRRAAARDEPEEIEAEQVERPAAPTPDITPKGMRNREYSLSTDPKALDRPMRVPDFSNYKLPYDPSKTYAPPVGRNLSMMLDALGMEGTSANIRERQQSLARTVRAAFNEPDWSDEYALGRMFNIVDEATDLDFDEVQSEQSAEMMARVQEMIANMIDEQIATAEGLERPGSRINIDMSDDGGAPTGPLTPIVRGSEANRYNRLLERLRDPDGGFTFVLTEFNDVTTGWAIARKGFGIKLPASDLFGDDEEAREDAADRVEALIQIRQRELLERGTEEGRIVALGGWHDPVTGIVYLDVVDVYSKDRMSSEEAVAEGLSQNQLKITDLDVLQLALADDDWSRTIFIESGGNGEDVTDPVLLERYVELIRSARLARSDDGEAQPESGRTGSASAPPRAKAEIIDDYGTWIEGRATVTDGPFMMGNREFPGLEADIQWSVARSPGIIDDDNINAAQATVRIPVGWVGGDEIIETAYLPRTAQRGKSLQALINKAYRKAATKWLREYRRDRERRGLENTRGLADYDGSAVISIDGDIPDLIALSQRE